MTAPRLVDPATGTSIALDLAGVDLALPALLPTTPQERGIEANNTRTRQPTSVILDVITTDMPGAGDSRETVEAQIDAWATAATRLRLVVPYVPVVDNLIIGSRGLVIGDTTSGRWSITVQEVREVQPQRGAEPFPEILEALGDVTAPGEEGGEQSGRPVRRSLGLRALQGLGVAE